MGSQPISNGSARTSCFWQSVSAEPEQNQSSTGGRGHGVSGCRGVLCLGWFEFVCVPNPICVLVLVLGFVFPVSVSPSCSRPLFLTHPRLPSAVESPVRGCCLALFGLAELPVHSRASTSAHLSPPPLLLAEPRASHLDSTCTTGRSTRPRPLISALTIRRLDTYCTSVHTVCPALQFNRLTRPSATATLLPAPAPRHGTHTAAPRTPDPVVLRAPQLQLASSAR